MNTTYYWQYVGAFREGYEWQSQEIITKSTRQYTQDGMTVYEMGTGFARFVLSFVDGNEVQHVIIFNSIEYYADFIRRYGNLLHVFQYFIRSHIETIESREAKRRQEEQRRLGTR